VLLWLIVIWRRSTYGNDFDEVVQVALTVTFFASALTMYGQLLILKTRFFVLRFARHVTGLLLLTSAGLISGLVWEVIPIESRSSWFGGMGPSWQFLFLILPTSAAATVCLIIVPMVVRLVERRAVSAAESIPVKVQVQMTCPKCQAGQVLMNGPARCAACGFLMMIEIEEPRCECGYLLYRLAGTICPECGCPVPEDQRWLSAAGSRGLATGGVAEEGRTA
jgi:hypothetical protein